MPAAARVPRWPHTPPGPRGAGSGTGGLETNGGRRGSALRSHTGRLHTAPQPAARGQSRGPCPPGPPRPCLCAEARARDLFSLFEKGKKEILYLSIKSYRG